MNIKRALLTPALTALSLIAVAVPAKRGFFPVTQPDGSVLMVERVGDERNHLTFDENGRIVTEIDGAYYIARVGNDGTIESTGELARAVASQATTSSVGKPSPVEQLREVISLRNSISAPHRSIAQGGMGRFSGNFPRKGKVRGLVILVQYQDVKFKLSDPKAYFSNLLMKEGFNEYNGTGSAHDYFIENSGGAFDPQFDVFGPFTLANNRSYYGGNDSYGNDEHAHDMVVESCRGLDYLIDFADYDMDNDGYVDNVFVFYAGQGEASGGPDDSVWPHQWELAAAGRSLSLDDKRINKYACTNEWMSGAPDGVGTFIHEFSHVMGLPDLYDPNYKVDNTPGDWSVLDSGPYNNNGRTPPNYSIFERNAMEWCEPRVLDTPATVELEHIATSNDGCLIPTPKDSEFFLLENRQKTGWDKYIPGHGLLIWHIDFDQSVWNNNAVNSYSSHQYVEIEPANNNKNVSTGWSWPGTSKATSFTSSTKPALKTWLNRAINLPITDIAEINKIISFKVAGGIPPFDAPVAVNPTNVHDNGFTAAWQPVDGATDYLLTVFALSSSPDANSDIYDGGTVMNGWTKSFTTIYDTSGNYGVASPSLKFGSTGCTLTSPEYENDVTGISFWHKGNATDASSYLAIQGLVNGNWVDIDKVYPTTNLSATYTTADITLPAGIRQVKFVYNKGKGNMAVDDVTVTYAGLAEEILSNFKDISTGGATSYDVDVTGIGSTIYSYYVKATDGTAMSDPSKKIQVNLKDQSGIEDVIAGDNDAPVEYYNLQGVRVDNPVPGTLYIRRCGHTASKVIIR